MKSTACLLLSLLLYSSNIALAKTSQENELKNQKSEWNAIDKAIEKKRKGPNRTFRFRVHGLPMLLNIYRFSFDIKVHPKFSLGLIGSYRPKKTTGWKKSFLAKKINIENARIRTEGWTLGVEGHYALFHEAMTTGLNVSFGALYNNNTVYNLPDGLEDYASGLLDFVNPTPHFVSFYTQLGFDLFVPQTPLVFSLNVGVSADTYTILGSPVLPFLDLTAGFAL